MNERMLVCCCVFLTAPLWAQDRRLPGPSDMVVQTKQLSMKAVADAPGFPAEQRFRSRATALVFWQGKVYGIAAGGIAFLFSVQPDGATSLISRLPGTDYVRGALVSDGGGNLCVGTTPPLEGEGIVQAFTHPEAVTPFRNLSGGHVLCTNPAAPNPEWRDFGPVAEHEGIYALTSDPGRHTLYGVTFPSGVFFSLNVASGQVKTHGKLFEQARIGVDEYFRPVPRALAVDTAGVVWTSGNGGHLFRYDPGRDALEQTDLRLPGVPGREFLNVLDTLVPGPQDVLYGGTSDGYLFRLDPVHLRTVNLGRASDDARIRALIYGRSGKFYGVTGSAHGICRVFSYDPHESEFRVLGIIEKRDPSNYDWLIYQIDAMATDADGRLYFAEAESPAHIAVTGTDLD